MTWSWKRPIAYISWRVLSLQRFTITAGHRIRLPKAHIQNLLWALRPRILTSLDRTWDDCTLEATRRARIGMASYRERTLQGKRKGNWSLVKFSQVIVNVKLHRRKSRKAKQLLRRDLQLEFWCLHFCVHLCGFKL